MKRTSIIIVCLVVITFGILLITKKCSQNNNYSNNTDNLVPVESVSLVVKKIYSKEIEECDKKLGDWFWNKKTFKGYCSMPPDDWGDTCYKDSDCELYCSYKGVGEDGYLYGICSSYGYSCGDKTIPSKTKDLEGYRHGLCLQ